VGRRESVASLTRISGIIGVIDDTGVRSITGVVTQISHFTGAACVTRVSHVTGVTGVTGAVTRISHFTGAAGVTRVTHVPGLSRIAGLAGITGTGRLMPVGTGRVAGVPPAAHVASVPRQRGTNT
jgi:hypothetical protein